MTNSSNKSFILLLAAAASIPAIGNIIRNVRLHAWGPLIAEGVRLLVVIACIYLVQKSRQNEAVNKGDLGLMAIYALLVTSCFADLAPLLTRH